MPACHFAQLHNEAAHAGMSARVTLPTSSGSGAARRVREAAGQLHKSGLPGCSMIFNGTPAQASLSALQACMMNKTSHRTAAGQTASHADSLLVPEVSICPVSVLSSHEDGMGPAKLGIRPGLHAHMRRQQPVPSFGRQRRPEKLQLCNDNVWRFPKAEALHDTGRGPPRPALSLMRKSFRAPRAAEPQEDGRVLY